MFYEKQPIQNRENYKKMLSIIGNLTMLFSESDCPYLPYRAHENIFCKYFEAENLARLDCSADAKKDSVGIGLKTWTGQDDQKVAEFGKLRETFKELKGIDLVRKITEYRNERIRVTKKLNGIDEMIYHIIKRVPGAMQILEHTFDYIDINNLTLLPNRGNVNNTYFTDGKHTYHFSTSKNTLYMIFNDSEKLDSFEVQIMEDPYNFLMNLMRDDDDNNLPDDMIHVIEAPKSPQICLRLYATKKGEKYVPEKSGLNQWNAGGRRRDPDEIYIPYLKDDREKAPDFFPPRDTVFNLRLPDGTEIPAKVCQDAYKKMPEKEYNTLSLKDKLIEDKRRNEGKAIMSNPNKILGKWLLRDVFDLSEGTVVKYDMLEKFGVDSVIFTKHGDLEYSVDFAEIGTYEDFYEED